MEGYWIYIISTLILGIIFGCITKTINENKGYDGGFAWGFWLGWIGLIVVACRPNNVVPTKNPEDNSGNTKVLSTGGWKCHKCKRVNASYVTTCICGLSKEENQKLDKAAEKLAAQPTVINEKDELAKFKKMFEDGIITEQEYQEKRKKILGL